MKEDPITIGNSEPEPDLAVVEMAIEDILKAKPETARFVVEVAISSLALDREKGKIYAEAEIPEYWIVRPKDGLVEVYRQPQDGIYTEKSEIPASETLESSAIPGFSLNLAEALKSLS